MNELDKEEITEELNQLAIEDALTGDFCQLSINAISGADTESSIKLKTLVKDKVMLILLDSGSSYNFVSRQFAELANLPTIPMPPRRVKQANGECITTNSMVQNLQWYIQGHTLSADMVVLDMAPYDAIPGFDWLKLHSPMECD